MIKFLNKIIFFIGWLLSPLTFWNDTFVNIPLAYICANLFIRFFPVNFLITVLVFYWLSNVLGLLMMYLSGKSIFQSGKGLVREMINLLITMAIYILVLIILTKAGILKPIYL